MTADMHSIHVLYGWHSMAWSRAHLQIIAMSFDLIFYSTALQYEHVHVRFNCTINAVAHLHTLAHSLTLV